MSGLAVVPPASQQRWHELYKAAPLVIILLYMRTRGDRPVTQVEIAENFQIARNTAARSLRQLAQLGAIYKVDHNKGYELSDGGRQMLLELDEHGCSTFEHPSLKESFKSLIKDSKDSKDMKERKKRMLNLGRNQILSETGGLFPGHEIVNFGLPDDLQPDYILAWLAQAYDQHQAGKISHPWALVYRRLQTRRTLPDKKYQVDPLSFLPREFLLALDLPAPDPIETALEGEIVRIIEYQSSVEADVYDAWMTVLEKLRAEMPKASFETWVRDSYPVCYDENDLLSIAVRNLYAADWLKSRLTSTVQRMLARILNNAGIRVEFVVVTDMDD